MAFADGAIEVISTDGTMRARMCSTDSALRCFRFGSHVTPRLIWVDPDPVGA